MAAPKPPNSLGSADALNDAPTPLLEARGVTRRFGTFTALDGVDFAVYPGEVHALLGENGAGKSTLMNLLSGLLRPTTGDVCVEGAPVRFASPADAAARGIGMVHQHFLLVPPLTVTENLMLGASQGGALSYPTAAVLEEARAIADRLGWRIPWDSPAGDLPVGTQQRVEILKALRGETRVLIFDEPTAVLTPTETPELFETIRRLAAEGRGLVFISHKLDEVLTLAHRITVLRRGQVVLRTTPAETNASGLAEAMVGRDSEAADLLRRESGSAYAASANVPLDPVAPPAQGSAVTKRSAVLWRPESTISPDGELPGNSPSGEIVDSQPGTPHSSLLPPHDVQTKSSGTLAPAGQAKESQSPRLHVHSLTLRTPNAPRPALDSITFDVAAGEVFGIAGVDGNGQAELADCLAGLTRPSAGAISVEGVAPLPVPAAFRRVGVAVVPADRQTRGLALPLSITENLALGVQDEKAFRRGPLLMWPRLRERAAGLIRRFDIRATGPEAATRSLSGGNQQKVVIARALSEEPRVLVVVNPTRGLDVGAIAYVHDALRQAQAAGVAIVLISTELSEVLTLSDRVAVLFEGAFTGIVPPNTPREEIGLLMGGRRREEPVAA